MKELRGRLVVENGNSTVSHNYGAINVAFEDTSPNTKVVLFLVYMRGFQIVTLRILLMKVGWP